MIPEWTPMRWPSAWKDPSALSLLIGTAVDCLLVEKGDELEPVRSRARQEGFKVTEPNSPLSGITVIDGEWPGVKLSRGGDPDQVSAGPTGAPWIDSNGWKIRLAAATHPDSAVWVNASPRENTRTTASSYLIAVADAAAHGGRWVISLNTQLAAGIVARKPESLEVWKKTAAAAGFFAARKAWAGYAPQAVVGVVSDFSGENEFFNHELLNLLPRAGQHYRILPKDRVSDSSFDDLRALIWADAGPPPLALRRRILAFVEAGGMLITVPKWGEVPATPAKVGEHPRFSLRALGKGRVAVANADPDDPYVFANDSAVLVSHRHDLVRFWNGGAAGSYYTMAPGRKQALVHLLFYTYRGPDSATVRVAGQYRTAKMSTVEQPAVRDVEMESQKGAVEVHLPPVSQYVALELET